jgi:hypothetical protein
MICWGTWVLSLFLLNPEKAGALGFILFYLSLFLAILGTTAIIGFLVRARLGKTPIFVQVSIAFRQGLWLSGMITVYLILKGLNLLRWWNFTIFVLLIIIIEAMILTGKKRMQSVE